jgi:hypothetical protein
MHIDNSYVFESHMVEDFEKKISDTDNPFDINKMAFEFNYLSGKTDIVGETNQGELIAFEVKLDKWRVALYQAYRNSSFANYSYVILPKLNSKKALKQGHEFTRRGVGLCSIGQSGIFIEIEATWKKPIQPWLTHSALKHINGEENERAKATTS